MYSVYRSWNNNEIVNTRR